MAVLHSDRPRQINAIRALVNCRCNGKFPTFVSHDLRSLATIKVTQEKLSDCVSETNVKVSQLEKGMQTCLQILYATCHMAACLTLCIFTCLATGLQLQLG